MVISRCIGDGRPALRLLSLAALLVAAPALPDGAAPGEPLDLATALARARANAGEVVAARDRADAATERARAARAFRLPQLRFEESWLRTDSPAEVFALELDQRRFSFADFAATDPNRPAPLSSATSRLELTIPVWTGGELSTRVAQADLGARAAAAGATGAGDAAALAAAEAYIRLAEARESVALLERARETMAQHLAIARAYAGEGMVVRSEVLRAEVELSRVDDLLAAARGDADLAESGLAFRLGAPLETTYALAPLGDPPAIAGDLASWLASADARPDLDAARRRLAAGELEAKAARAAGLPQVALVARHDWVDDRLFGGRGESSAVMAVASVPIFSGGRHRAAAAAARAEAEAARADVDRFAAAVRLEVRQAFEAERVARERRETARSALAAADEAVRITEERFRSGVARTIDFVDAVTARREAETRELTARADAHLAALTLAVRAGRRPESVVGPAPAADPGGGRP